MASHGKRKHSRFAASSADRWLNCPGSVQLSEKSPPKVDTDASREGTEAHECLEYLMRRFANIMEAAKVKHLWPLEMINHGVESARSIMQLRPSPSAELMIEKRVIYNESKGMFGTLDYAWVENWGELVVIDYKYGRGLVLPVDSTGRKNPQLMYYASALLKECGYDFESVTLAIVQPRVSEGATLTTVTVEDVLEFDEEVETAVELALQKNPPLKAGPHCRYCPASLTCPEISRNTMAEANILFDFEESEVLALPEVRGLDSATVGRMLQAADVLDVWIKAVREYAYVNAQRGEAIKGYKLVPKRALRYWDEGAESKLEKTFGKDAYVVKKVFLSPAELERSKGAAGKEFTAKHAQAFSSGYTLVPDTDARPGVELGSVFDFD